MTSVHSRVSVRNELEGSCNHKSSSASKSDFSHSKSKSSTLLPQNSSKKGPSSGTSSTEDDSAGVEESVEGDDDDTHNDNSEDGIEPKDLALPQGTHGLGLGKGKGKGPGIRVHSGKESGDAGEASNPPHPGAGLKIDTTVSISPDLKRKRRESSGSITPGLGTNSTPIYPRKRVSKGLKHNDAGLLEYHDVGDEPVIVDEQHLVSEDGYEGVNDVSNSEEGDSDIERFEENMMLDPDRDHFFRRNSIESIDDNILNAVLNRSMMDEMSGEGILEDEVFQVPSDLRKYSDSSAKRVRFLDEVHIEAFEESSSSTESEDMESTYPDLFHDQTKDSDAFLVDINSDSDNSYWDFHEDDQSHTFPVDDDLSDAESPEAGSSGYESDTGETTEEDEPPPPSATSTRSVLRPQSSAVSSHVASPSPFRRNSHQSSKKKAPPLGHFIVDPFKVVACVDRTGRNIMFDPPIIPNRNSLRFAHQHGPQTNILGVMADDSDVSDGSQHPLGTDVMFGGLFGSMTGQNLHMNGALIGPIEAFFPNPPPMDTDEQMFDSQYTSDSIAGHEEDAIEDFVDFGEDESDEENEEVDMNIDATPLASSAEDNSTVARGRSHSLGDPTLSHLSGISVTSFRNNQNRHRNVAQLPADPDLRASAAKPVRSGKTAETPITPLRKRGNSFRQRRGGMLDSSPLLNRADAAVSKRGRGPRLGTF